MTPLPPSLFLLLLPLVYPIFLLSTPVTSFAVFQPPTSNLPFLSFSSKSLSLSQPMRFRFHSQSHSHSRFSITSKLTAITPKSPITLLTHTYIHTTPLTPVTKRILTIPPFRLPFLSKSIIPITTISSALVSALLLPSRSYFPFPAKVGVGSVLGFVMGKSASVDFDGFVGTLPGREVTGVVVDYLSNPDSYNDTDTDTDRDISSTLSNISSKYNIPLTNLKALTVKIYSTILYASYTCSSSQLKLKEIQTLQRTCAFLRLDEQDVIEALNGASFRLNREQLMYEPSSSSSSDGDKDKAIDKCLYFSWMILKSASASASVSAAAAAMNTANANAIEYEMSRISSHLPLSSSQTWRTRVDRVAARFYERALSSVRSQSRASGRISASTSANGEEKSVSVSLSVSGGVLERAREQVGVDGVSGRIIGCNAYRKEVTDLLDNNANDSANDSDNDNDNSKRKGKGKGFGDHKAASLTLSKLRTLLDISDEEGRDILEGQVKPMFRREVVRVIDRIIYNSGSDSGSDSDSGLDVDFDVDSEIQNLKELKEGLLLSTSATRTAFKSVIRRSFYKSLIPAFDAIAIQPGSSSSSSSSSGSGSGSGLNDEGEALRVLTCIVKAKDFVIAVIRGVEYEHEVKTDTNTNTNTNTNVEIESTFFPSPIILTPTFQTATATIVATNTVKIQHSRERLQIFKSLLRSFLLSPLPAHNNTNTNAINSGKGGFDDERKHIIDSTLNLLGLDSAVVLTAYKDVVMPLIIDGMDELTSWSEIELLTSNDDDDDDNSDSDDTKQNAIKISSLISTLDMCSKPDVCNSVFRDVSMGVYKRRLKEAADSKADGIISVGQSRGLVVLRGLLGLVDADHSDSDDNSDDNADSDESMTTAIYKLHKQTFHKAYIASLTEAMSASASASSIDAAYASPLLILQARLGISDGDAEEMFREVFVAGLKGTVRMLLKELEKVSPKSEEEKEGERVRGEFDEGDEEEDDDDDDEDSDDDSDDKDDKDDNSDKKKSVGQRCFDLLALFSANNILPLLSSEAASSEAASEAESHQANANAKFSYEYPFTTVSIDLLKLKDAKSIYRQFYIEGFQERNETIALQFTESGPRVAGILGISDSARKEVSSEIGNLVFNNYMNEQFKTRSASSVTGTSSTSLTEGDYAFLLQLQAKTGMTKFEVECMADNLQESVLASRIERAFSDGTVLTADKCKACRDEARELGKTFRQLNIEKNRIQRMFQAEVEGGIEDGSLVSAGDGKSGEQLTEMMDVAGFDADEAQELVELLISKKCRQKIRAISADIAQGNLRRAMGDIKTFVKYVRFTSGEGLDLEIDDGDKEKMLEMFTDAVYVEEGGREEESDLESLSVALRNAKKPTDKVWSKREEVERERVLETELE